MQTYEIDAYLGEFADDLPEDRKATLGQALDKLAVRWPSPDFDDVQTSAGNAATELAYGDSTVEQIAAEYQAARKDERLHRLRLTGAIVWTALAEPMLSEQTIADRFGVTRMTVRKALAKS